MQFGLPFWDIASTPPTGVLPAPPPAGSPLVPIPDSVGHASLEPMYFVRHRQARRYLLRVEEDGRLRVTIPRGGSRREADDFVRRHVEWVARQRQHLRPRPTWTTPDAEVLRARARTELPPRLHALAHEHGLVVSKVSVRSQRTRWGSCGRDGHICLNWRLVLMPEWVCDYVLVHELMHLRRLDHSAQYWALVAAACPSYRDARAWLRVNGPGLR